MELITRSLELLLTTVLSAVCVTGGVVLGSMNSGALCRCLVCFGSGETLGISDLRAFFQPDLHSLPPTTCVQLLCWRVSEISGAGSAATELREH